jgi:hypothetical protein
MVEVLLILALAFIGIDNIDKAIKGGNQPTVSQSE